MWFVYYRWDEIVAESQSVNWAASIASVALLAAVAANVKLVTQVYMMNEKINFLNPSVWLRIVKLATAAGLMLICLWVPFQFLDNVVFDTTRVIPLLALTATTTAIGGIVYLVLCHVLQVSEQNLLWDVVLRFPGFRKVVRTTQSVLEPIMETELD